MFFKTDAIIWISDKSSIASNFFSEIIKNTELNSSNLQCQKNVSDFFRQDDENFLFLRLKNEGLLFFSKGKQ